MSNVATIFSVNAHPPENAGPYRADQFVHAGPTMRPLTPTIIFESCAKASGTIPQAHNNANISFLIRLCFGYTVTEYNQKSPDYYTSVWFRREVSKARFSYPSSCDSAKFKILIVGPITIVPSTFGIIFCKAWYVACASPRSSNSRSMVT